jgi:hypothetical protein
MVPNAQEVGWNMRRMYMQAWCFGSHASRLPCIVLASWFTRPHTDPQPQNYYLFSKLLLLSVPHVLAIYIHIQAKQFFFQNSKEFVSSCIKLYSVTRFPGNARFISFPHRPDRFRVPPRFISNGYTGSFPGAKATGTWSWPLTSI